MDLMWWLEREDQEFCQVFHLYNWVDMISILEVGTMKSASYTWNLTQCTENVEIAVIQRAFIRCQPLNSCFIFLPILS